MKFLIEQLFVIVAVIGLLVAFVFAAKAFTSDLRRKRNGYRVRHGKLFAIFMAFAMILILLAIIPSASAQLSQLNLITATNLPAVLSPQSFSNSITSYIPLRNNSGIAATWRFTASAGTSNVCMNLYPTIDGTNVTTTAWAFNGNASGTGTNIISTNWSAAQLSGYVGFFIGGMTNQNNGTITNGGVNFNKWSAPTAY